MSAAQSGLCLGIDLGTTSIKVSLVDIQSQSLLFSTSEITDADIDIKNEPQRSEQDVAKIMQAVCSCLMRITDKHRSLVKCVGVCGQMHGVMLWNNDMQSGLEDGKLDSCNTSSLITWQDQRASSKYIATLPKPDSHQNVAAGFGCVTLFWLRQFEPEMFVRYNTVGGIMDYMVTLLCGLDKPVMSDQIASSWGYLSSETMSWNLQILKDAGFPVYLLPVVVQSGSQAGTLCAEWCGIPKGTPVLAGLGDLQCSFVSSSKQGTDAVMNISTSSQLCYPVLSSGFTPPRFETASPITFFPFFKQTYLAVAASLNGGNALSAFVTMLQEWFNIFDVNMDRQIIWKKLTDLASSNTHDGGTSGLVIQPLLYGERHNPLLTGSISGANKDNTSLDCVFRSMCEGLVTNLNQMIPLPKLIESGISRLIVTGSVIDKQPYLMEYVRRLYAPLTVIEQVGIDASFGVGLVACKFVECVS